VCFIWLNLHSLHCRISMDSGLDWVPVLVECKENVRLHVQPLLKTVKEQQPDLGSGAGGDQMKLVDLAAEKAIVEVLLRRCASFTLISEESGVKVFGDRPESCFVTVDPIDGTTNLVRGLPFYCTSIAVSREPMLSQVHAGLVSDLFHSTTYTAALGKGTFRNGEKITPSKVESLEEAVVGLDLNTYKVKEIAPRLSGLIAHTKHIRHYGANALELCFVAEGLTDAFVDVRGKLRTTDVAAGFLIVKEAGGIVTAPDGKAVDARLDPKETLKFVASGNRQIHEAILRLLDLK
jgi:myo-inositol-1(or 4)-monophosphatase